MRVARWRAALVAAFLAISVGLFVGRGEFLLLAVVPLSYVAYGYTSAPVDPRVRVERSLSEDEPVPGDEVTVRLRVENGGDRTLGDLRVVDGVPEDVAVVDGDPALATALRPGEAATVEYEVRPSRGDHEFADPQVRVRNLAGTSVDTRAVAVEGDATVTCETILDEFPTRQETIQYVGGVPTGVTGSGVEFHSTREYRRGDPLSRIDWKRLARTGELTTVEFRTERSVVVVFVVDDRETARVPAAGGGPDAVDLATHAASRGLVTLVDAGHRVGVARLSAVERGLGPGEWVEPGSDETTRTAAAAEFDRVGRPPGDPTPGAANTGPEPAGRERTPGEPDRWGERRPGEPDGDGPSGGAGEGRTPVEPGDDGRPGASDAGGSAADRGEDLALALSEHLPSRAQVVVCSPLVDEVVPAMVTRLLASGHGASVLSPDVYGPGEDRTRTVARLERRNRVYALQSRGVPTTDWDADTPLPIALGEAFARWRGETG